MSTVSFSTTVAARQAGDSALPEGGSDDPNLGVTVLTIVIPPGSHTVTVAVVPQWILSDSDGLVPPPIVALDEWKFSF